MFIFLIFCYDSAEPQAHLEKILQPRDHEISFFALGVFGGLLIVPYTFLDVIFLTELAL